MEVPALQPPATIAELCDVFAELYPEADSKQNAFDFAVVGRTVWANTYTELVVCDAPMCTITLRRYDPVARATTLRASETFRTLAEVKTFVREVVALSVSSAAGASAAEESDDDDDYLSDEPLATDEIRACARRAVRAPLSDDDRAANERAIASLGFYASILRTGHSRLATRDV